MKTSVLELYEKFNVIIQYLFFSILSTLLDTTVVWTMFHIVEINLTISNTIGVVSGFFLSYFLSLKKVFNADHGLSSFIIYLFTSVIGLILANYLITTVFLLSIKYCTEWFAFILAKGASIVFPFFIMYFMRKYLYIWLNKRRNSHE